MEDKSVFDMDALMRSTCDDKELAGQVIGVFLSDIPEQLDNLRDALTAGDAATAERVAHSIKGASATVGGERLRAIAFDCEMLGKKGDLDVLRGMMEQLREEYDVLRRVLRGNGFSRE